MGKILFAFIIEELPKHIHGEQRIIVIWAIVINKPLKTLDFIATVILDEVEHTALIGIKRRRNVLQQKRCIRMNWQDIYHFLIGNPRNSFYDLPGILCSITQIAQNSFPVRCDFRVVILLHCRAHQLEGNVFGQTDQAVRTNKTSVQLDEILISLMEQTLCNMGNKNEIERLSLTDFAKLLEAG